MLTEIQDVRQISGEGSRRWFSDAEFDLIVWFQGDEPDGFQLCYDLSGYPRVYTWKKSAGSTHHGIDDGERPAGYKATPVLVADGLFDAPKVLPAFVEASKSLPLGIRMFVLSNLPESPDCRLS